jgi:hypothetical protein
MKARPQIGCFLPLPSGCFGIFIVLFMVFAFMVICGALR